MLSSARRRGCLSFSDVSGRSSFREAFRSVQNQSTERPPRLLTHVMVRLNRVHLLCFMGSVKQTTTPLVSLGSPKPVRRFRCSQANNSRDVCLLRPIVLKSSPVALSGQAVSILHSERKCCHSLCFLAFGGTLCEGKWSVVSRGGDSQRIRSFSSSIERLLKANVGRGCDRRRVLDV